MSDREEILVCTRCGASGQFALSGAFEEGGVYGTVFVQGMVSGQMRSYQISLTLCSRCRASFHVWLSEGQHGGDNEIEA